MKKAIFFLLLCIGMLSACSISSEAVPQDHFYRLPEVAIEALPTPLYDSLQLHAVQAKGLYNERNILYVEASRPLKVNRYHYHYWMQSPSGMVEKYLAQAIKTSQVAKEYFDSRSRANADVRLSVEIIRFERVLDDSGINVQVALQAHVEYPNALHKPWHKLYVLQQPVESSDMEDTARVFGGVLSSLSQQIIQDLAKKH